MHNEFTAVFERSGDWVIAYCPEIPGANGQGHTKEEASVKRSSLLRYMRQHGCVLKREGGSHSLWTNPAQSASSPRRLLPASHTGIASTSCLIREGLRTKNEAPMTKD